MTTSRVRTGARRSLIASGGLGDASPEVELPPDRWPLLWVLLGVGAVAALYIALRPEGHKRRSD